MLRSRESEIEHLDLSGQLFRAAPELHAPLAISNLRLKALILTQHQHLISTRDQLLATEEQTSREKTSRKCWSTCELRGDSSGVPEAELQSM
jgi:hypothetical protein